MIGLSMWIPGPRERYWPFPKHPSFQSHRRHVLQWSQFDWCTLAGGIRSYAEPRSWICTLYGKYYCPTSDADY